MYRDEYEGSDQSYLVCGREKTSAQVPAPEKDVYQEDTDRYFSSPSGKKSIIIMFSFHGPYVGMCTIILPVFGIDVYLSPVSCQNY
jgi:hypothetical protein